MNKSDFDIVKFNNALAEIKLAMMSSPTKGLSVFHSMWLYEKDQTVLDSLIEGLRSRMKNAEKKVVLKNFIENLELVRTYALKSEARAIFEAIQDSLIYEISNDCNMLQMYQMSDL